MRIRCLCVILLFVSASMQGQTVTSPAGTAVSQAPGDRTWSNLTNATGNVNATESSAGVLNPGNPSSEVLVLTNFNFSTLPASIVINGISATVTRRSSGGTARDIIVELVKGGVIQTAANLANTTDWPTTLTAINYGSATQLWSNTWTRADVTASNFGIAISVNRNTGNNTAAIDAVTITIHYSVVFPILVSSFDIKMTSNGQASISFTTETEEKVKWLFVERSADGQIYTDLIKLAPRGGSSIRTNYILTDPQPLKGTSYYRLKELDVDGNYHYYDTRKLNNTDVSETFVARQVNGNILLSLHQPAGNYTIELLNINGTRIYSKTIQLKNTATQFSISNPVWQTGIYQLSLKGNNGVIESVKLFIQR